MLWKSWARPAPARIYAMPILHNPLGRVMRATEPSDRDRSTARFTRLIIEDAVYAYLAQDPPPPPATTAP